MKPSRTFFLMRLFLPGLVLCMLWLLHVSCRHCRNGVHGEDRWVFSDSISPGAWQMHEYLPMLKGKRVAVSANHTSMVGDRHLVDTLLVSGVNVVKIFSPEHGFRGQAAAGERVESGIDTESGLPVISLYGRNRRPTAEQLADVDIILFDIQDVGVRFYTYISTLTYLMQAAAREDIPVIVLDRPNPLIHYVDGPVLELKYGSFVGLHPVPVVYGMSIGEYARMVNGENWLGFNLKAQLEVIPVARYTRSCRYRLPIAPSPNLPNMHAVYLYPALCLFEGTDISLGRGTDFPFQVFGHPDLDPDIFSFQFVPQSVTAAPNPPQLGKVCFGRDMRNLPIEVLMANERLDLNYLLEAYRYFPQKQAFFNSFFERLAGNDLLRVQILAGLTEDRIRESWQEDLEAFIRMREPYLIYPPE